MSMVYEIFYRKNMEIFRKYCFREKNGNVKTIILSSYGDKNYFLVRTELFVIGKPFFITQQKSSFAKIY